MTPPRNVRTSRGEGRRASIIRGSSLLRNCHPKSESTLSPVYSLYRLCPLCFAQQPLQLRWVFFVIRRRQPCETGAVQPRAGKGALPGLGCPVRKREDRDRPCSLGGGIYRPLLEATRQQVSRTPPHPHPYLPPRSLPPQTPLRLAPASWGLVAAKNPSPSRGAMKGPT